MSAPRRPERPQDPERLAAWVLSELARPVRGPELTGAVMARLGFMKAHSRVVRRKRMRRWLGRALTVGVALGVIGAGLRIHQRQVEARRPQRTTIPAAISHDLHEYQRRLDRVVESLRSLMPPTGAPAAAPATTEPAAEPAVESAGEAAQWI